MELRAAPKRPTLAGMSWDAKGLIWALLAAVSGSAAPPALLIDLASPGDAAQSITRIYGSAGNGQFGVPVCGGFDCNGDGQKDVAFSQMTASPLGRSSAGMVTLVFFNGQFGAGIDTSGFTNNILKIAGDGSGENTGSEIWMDDLNDDGLGDLLIGRQNFSPEPARAGAGALTIIFGSPQLTTAAGALDYFDLRSLPANVSVVSILGERAYDRLGIWLRTGDVDGDGIADLLLGADEHEDPGAAINENSGAVYLFRGGPHWNAITTNVDLASFGEADFVAALQPQVAKIVPPTESTDGHFGATCAIGDLDGNGRAEVLIAATINRAGAALRLADAPIGTGDPIGGIGKGAAFIAWDENFPEGPWPNGYSFRIDQPTLGQFTRIDGGTNNNAFGEELLGTSDFSGDGFPDLFLSDLVAASPNGANSGIGYVIWNASELRGLTFDILTPPSGVALTTIYGPSPGAIGADTVAAGDFDRDGITDLAVGNPHDSTQGRIQAGSVHVLFGQAGGWPALVDLRPVTGLPDPADLRITQIDAAKGAVGTNRPDTLCYSAAAADLNGDGHTDLIANEMIGDGIAANTVDVGNLLVISGAGMIPPQSPPLAAVEASLDFGSRRIGNATDDVALLAVATNASASPVTTGAISLEGPTAAEFVVDHDTGAMTLQPGDTRTIMLRLQTNSVGLKGAALRMETDSHPLRFRLFGQNHDPNQRPFLDQLLFGDREYLRISAGQRGLIWQTQTTTNLPSWQIHRSNLPGTGGPMLILRNNSVEVEFFRAAASP